MARAFPTYSSKTPAGSPQTVTISFIVVGEGVSPVTDDDVRCLSAECEGGRSSVVILLWVSLNCLLVEISFAVVLYNASFPTFLLCKMLCV